MRRVAIIIAGIALFIGSSARADEPIVYPAKGQSSAQQERDEYECHQWATKDTGVDPEALAEQKLQTPTPSAQHEGGALRGAGMGAAGGAMEGDAAGGAARGFGIGRMVSVMRAKKKLREQQSNGSADAAQIQGQLEKYDRAYAACLTGRGYSVK